MVILMDKPAWTRKGFCKPLYGEVTQAVNAAIGRTKKAKLIPVAILLGPTASAIFAWEHGSLRISKAPKVYSDIPVVYRVVKLSGVAVIGKPREPSSSLPSPSA